MAVHNLKSEGHEKRGDVPHPYRMVVWFLSFLTNIYFREISSSGSIKIPREGGVIFVAGPHVNQMIDPVLVIRTILERSQRSVSSLIPTVWLQTRIVGSIARWLDTITLERPIDFQKKGMGTISMSPNYDNTLCIIGHGTDFMKEAREGDLLFLPRYNGSTASATIKQILSPNKLILKRELSPRQNALEQLSRGSKTSSRGCSYFIAPKLDRSNLYKDVSGKLGGGGNVLIFPEGASHDTPGFLPLQTGAAVMALEEKVENPTSLTTIVPCGISYSEASRFRSQAHIVFGDPIRVPTELAEMYRSGDKRSAIRSLEHEIREGLLNSSLACETDVNLLDTVRALSKLYISDSGLGHSCATEYKISRRIYEHYMKKKHEIDTMKLFMEMNHYQQDLKQMKLQDHCLKLAANTSLLRTLVTIAYKITIFVLALLLMLPGLLMFAPLIWVAEHYSRKRARFLTAISPQRIFGYDTIATGRIVAALAAAPLVCATYIVIVLGYLRYCEQEFCHSTNSISAVCFTIAVFVLTIFPTIFAADVASDTGSSLKTLAWFWLPGVRGSVVSLGECRKELSLKVERFMNDSENRVRFE